MATTSKEGSRRANYPILIRGGSDKKYHYRTLRVLYLNEYNLNTLTRNNWRASLVPAAAVIPAPIVYIKVAAVKKLVVGFRNAITAKARRKAWLGGRFLALGNGPLALRLGDHCSQSFTLKKLECSKQA